MNKRKIVIFGSSGFIGNDLSHLLKNKNFDIYDPSSKSLNLLNEKTIYKNKLKFKNSSIIYSAGKHRQHGDTIENMQNNILSMTNLLKAVNPNDINKFIFLSSAEIYGKIYLKKKIKETSLENPQNYYSLGKLFQEKLLRLHFKSHLKKLIILRLPGIYGRNDKQTSVISKIIFNLKNDNYFKLTTNGNDIRDYIFVGDLSKIILLIINSKKINTNNNILNICSGEYISINNLIKLVEKIFSKKLKIINIKIKLESTNLFFEKNLFLNKINFSKLQKKIKEEYI